MEAQSEISLAQPISAVPVTSTGVSTRRSSALHTTPIRTATSASPSTTSATKRTRSSSNNVAVSAIEHTTVEEGEQRRSEREITIEDSEDEAEVAAKAAKAAGSGTKAHNKNDLKHLLWDGIIGDESMDHTEHSNSGAEDDTAPMTPQLPRAEGEGEELGSEEGSEDDESESDSEDEEDGDDAGSIETGSARPLASSSRPTSPRHNLHPMTTDPDIIMTNGTASTSANPDTTTTNSMNPPPITDITARKRAPRAPRYRSPTPPPIRPYIPPPTVRLEIILPRRKSDDDDVPEFVISEMIIAAGYYLGQPEEEDGKASASGVEGDTMQGAEGEKGSKLVDNSAVITRTATGEVVLNPVVAPIVPAKRQRTRKILGRDDGYNVDDPFVDDSELEVFEPKYYHRPAREGYFVATGIVEVISDSKPVSRRTSTSAVKPKKVESTGPPLPFNKTPIVIDDDSNDDDDGDIATTFGASVALATQKKKRKKGEFSPEMMTLLQDLRVEAAKHSFVPKNKFPPSAKTLLIQVSLRAIQLGEFDEEYLAILPRIFPYNNFTLKKLVTREVFEPRVADLRALQNQHLNVISTSVDRLLPAAKIEYAAALVIYKARVEERRIKIAEEQRLAKELNERISRGGTNGSGAAGDVNTGGMAALPATAPEIPEIAEPKKKILFSEAMRMSLYHVLTLEDTWVDLINEKQDLEKDKDKDAPQKKVGHVAARKALYNKITLLFKDWITTGQLSREMSNTKKKIERLQAAAIAAGDA